MPLQALAWEQVVLAFLALVQVTRPLQATLVVWLLVFAIVFAPLAVVLATSVEDMEHLQAGHPHAEQCHAEPFQAEDLQAGQLQAQQLAMAVMALQHLHALAPKLQHFLQ
jgi:hypothetical protein